MFSSMKKSKKSNTAILLDGFRWMLKDGKVEQSVLENTVAVILKEGDLDPDFEVEASSEELKAMTILIEDYSRNAKKGAWDPIKAFSDIGDSYVHNPGLWSIRKLLHTRALAIHDTLLTRSNSIHVVDKMYEAVQNIDGIDGLPDAIKANMTSDQYITASRLVFASIGTIVAKVRKDFDDLVKQNSRAGQRSQAKSKIITELVKTSTRVLRGQAEVNSFLKKASGLIKTNAEKGMGWEEIEGVFRLYEKIWNCCPGEPAEKNETSDHEGDDSDDTDPEVKDGLMSTFQLEI